MRSLFFAAAVLAAVVLSGCGDGPRGRIHGTVKFQGKPLTAATVIFIASDNRTHPVKLKSDGTYEVSGVAFGPVKVSIQPDLPAVASKADPRAAGARAATKGDVTDEKAGKAPPPLPVTAEKSGRQFPVTYTDPEQSKLSFQLTAADQEWSVDLK